MNLYTFKGLRSEDNLVSVLAPNEEEGRHEAMLKRWGPPGDRIVPYDKYKGIGLELISVETVDDASS